MNFFGNIADRLSRSPVTIIILFIFLVSLTYLGNGVIGDIKTFLGFNTKENVVKKLDAANKKIDVLTNVNEQNQKALVVAEGTAKNVEKAIVNVEEKSKAVDKKVATIQKKMEEKVVEVKAADLPEEEKKQKVSAVRIQGLWDVYCQNNEDAGCLVHTTPEKTGV